LLKRGKSPSWIPRKSNMNGWNWKKKDPKKILRLPGQTYCSCHKIEITWSKWNWKKTTKSIFQNEQRWRMNNEKKIAKKIHVNQRNFSSLWPKHKTGKVPSRKTMNLNPRQIKYWMMKLKKQSIILLLPNVLPYFLRIKKNKKNKNPKNMFLMYLRRFRRLFQKN